jgi:predicted transcriptional regulator
MASGDAPAPPPLGELEADVMDLLWRQGEATVRAVLEALNATTEKPRAYTTVMTVMGNLDRKGMLTRRRDGRTDVYTPVMSRQEYFDTRARAEAGALVGRYGDAAYMAFAREMGRLDPEHRRQLRRLARDG